MPIKITIDEIPDYNENWDDIPEYLSDIKHLENEHDEPESHAVADADDFRLDEYEQLNDGKEIRAVATPSQIVTGQMPLGPMRGAMLGHKNQMGERTILIRYDGEIVEVEPQYYRQVKDKFLPTKLYYDVTWITENKKGRELELFEKRQNFQRAVLDLPAGLRRFATEWYEATPNLMSSMEPPIISNPASPRKGSYDTALVQGESWNNMVGSNEFGKTD